MKALILGGGSLKGAWQAGAIQAVLETGFKPDMIYGISAGALNAGYIVNESGKQWEQNQHIDWELINKKLINFWLEHITKPSDIGKLKSRWMLGMETLLSRFDGLLDVEGLHNLFKRELRIEYIVQSPVRIKVGAVNVHTGEMYYASPNDAYFVDYILASSSIPIMMPTVQIGGDHRKAFLDGGLREVVPIKKAIEDGATEIYAIATHPKHRQMKSINNRSFFGLIERIKDISVNQFENNDIEWAENYNENLMSIAGFTLNRKISLHIIRPTEPLQIKLTNFNTKDVREMIMNGYEYAYNMLRSK
ncbi:patatin-like phospholipase family protein [Marinilongibacter aquaticus]|uniref:patatin-like phospholipase family protein n=1 Tax=Marinilongibacter aquaticus TaxID=2975157 RepID=UPI0021BDE882|nr:patatin-like phospholipase family protein [Marinilongibacter aquaticus]UBM60271.1 patatin-like phospholipase family protein [Marinilongibacter aquaticus]